MAKRFKPQAIHTKGIKPNKSVQPIGFTFGFTYWQERKYLGIGECSNAWFTSLIQRLRDLGKESIQSLIESKGAHFHPVGFEQSHKDCPITRQQALEMIPEAYQDDCVFYQFALSASTGRVVGFFDDRQSFQIILLDPKHNIYPYYKHEVRVDSTLMSKTDYIGLINLLDDLRDSQLCGDSCEVKQLLRTIPEYRMGKADTITLMVQISLQDLETLQILLESKYLSIQELLLQNLIHFL